MFNRQAIYVLAGAAMMSRILPAQQPDVVKDRFERIAIESHAVMQGPAGPGPIEFISSDMLPGQVVKGAPYSAEAVNESVQTLADGNRITRRTTAAVARDSEGRTRRESEPGPIGPLAAADAPRLAFIHDPVANAHYVLDEKTHTARKMLIRQSITNDGNRVEHTFNVRVAGPSGLGGHLMAPPNVVYERVQADKAAEKEEDLGTRIVEGVQAGGTRRILTIPAGQIGNERAIEIVTERWFSPELQTLVLSRHSDPRMGETTYRLTGISRAEPAKSLFEVPADYKVMEPGDMQRIELRKRSNQ
jgi:hypothetical protein